MLRKLTLLAVLCLSAASAFAADTKLVCTPLALKSQNKDFNLPGVEKSHTKKIYLFKNISQQSLWLDHPTEHAASSSSLSSYLRVNNASALLVNRKKFNINCSAITPGDVVGLDCEKVVSVCELKQSEVNSSRKGTYWLVEDKSWVEVEKLLVKKGVH